MKLFIDYTLKDFNIEAHYILKKEEDHLIDLLEMAVTNQYHDVNESAVEDKLYNVQKQLANLAIVLKTKRPQA